MPAVEVQNETNALIIGNAIKIKSKILKEERPIWVYLPEDYKTSQHKKFPVIYMLDGAYHFHHITGAVQILAKHERIPQMIVIAIPNIDRDRRARDFLPSSENGRPPVASADNFLAFLEKELIPFTDNNYRTELYKILVGHSRAGLFSIYALIERPELFNTYISISPSLYWDDRIMFKKTKTFSIEKSNLKRKLFLSVADGDTDQFKIPALDFAELLKKKKPAGLNVHFSFMENETHDSIVHRVFYNNLESLFSDWQLTPEQIGEMSFEQIKEYYRNLSNAYGYNNQVPSWALLLALRQLYYAEDINKTNKGIEISKLILDQDPYEPQAHFMIGYYYMVSGKLDSAREKLETAIKMVDESNTNLPMYRIYLNQVLKKIKESNPVE